MSTCKKTKLCLYKSGYSPLYNQYVEIVDHHHDVDGNVIYKCTLNDERVTILFRPEELTNLTL